MTLHILLWWWITPRESLIKEEKHMIYLINSTTPFSALEDRKVKAVHFNRFYILELSLLSKCYLRPYPVQKNVATLQIHCRFMCIYSFKYKEPRVWNDVESSFAVKRAPGMRPHIIRDCVFSIQFWIPHGMNKI